MKRLTTAEIAKRRGLTVSRVRAMLKQDQNPKRLKTHFPGAYLCECKKTWFIPTED